MNKLMMSMAAVVGMTSFAAQNDPLIPVEVEEGATYSVTCKGESLFTFTPSTTGKVNVQGVGAKSMNASDYEINLLAAAQIDDGTGNGNSVELEDFETPGPDSYGDGTLVLEGEFYALVWMKPGTDFKGFAIDERGVVCKDEVNNWFTRVYGNADGSSKCVRGNGVTFDPPSDWENGHFAIYVLDTRKPGANELSAPLNGLPTFVGGYKEVTSGEAVTSSGWTMLKFDMVGQKFAFDPSAMLEKGYAAIPSDDRSVWTVYAMPTAYHDIVEPQTLKANEYFLLCDPAKVNPQAKLDEEFTLDVTHEFKAFTDDVKAVVDAISPFMPKDRFGCADFKNLQAVNEQAYLAAQREEVTPEQLAAAKEFLTTASPFWKWDCDFEVSFNRPIAKGSYVLAGYYEQAEKFGFDGWVCSAFDEDLPSGKSLRLLKDNHYSGVYVSYYEICSRVQEFLCGVKNLLPENYGTTITVKLNIFDTTRDLQATVGTYKYTFGGPLYVNCYQIGTEEPVETVKVDDHKGTEEYPLPVVVSEDETQAFVGWSLNADGNGDLITTIPAMVHKTTTDKPVKTWYTKEEPLKLYAVYKPAKTVTIKPTKGSDPVPFKVTEEWLEENKIDQTSISSNLEEKVNDNSKLTYWQSYLLGIKPDADASLKVENTNGQEDDKALVVSTVQAPAPDAGFKVQYSLDKVESDESEVVKSGTRQDTKDLKIDLEPENDTPTGYYKMKVIVTPTVDGAAQSEVTIPADNTIGVLKVETSEPVVPVAVPWTSLESGEQINVKDIVKTSTLADGDLLHVYDKVNKTYINLEVKNGEWEQTKTIKIDESGTAVDVTPSLEELELATASRGSSVWLERKTNTDKPVYLLGQYKKEDKAETKIDAPKTAEEKQVANLIAPTSIYPTDLNAVLVPENVKAGAINANDQLMLVRDGLPLYYRLKDGKWGYDKPVYKVVNGRVRMTQEWVNDDAVVPAGIGFWYFSKGGDPTIVWPSDFSGTSAD